MALTKGDEKKFEDIVFRMLTKFYQNVLLSKMATKDDIKNMATKDDIKNMATKDDVVNLEKRMDEKMEGMEGRLTKRIDRVAEIVTDTRTNHERRIRKLEEEVGIEPEVKLVV